VQSDQLEQLRRDFLNAIKIGSGRQADKVVEAALESGVPADQIYLDVFQPTGYAVGRLWQENLFSVAQEHLATAIIEREMGNLHGHFSPRQDRQRTLVIGCVDGELHRVGAHMAADFFEQDGWTVYYLGASVPSATFIAMAREMQADLIGLASQTVYRIPEIVEFMRHLETHGLDGLPVMVGGQAFVQQPELVSSLGVHFSGATARDAVILANRLLLH
jgi:methanogenic corrinoid protein MtbC1